MDNIDKEYDHVLENYHYCTKKVESYKTTERRLLPETLELIHQRGVGRSAGNQKLTYKLARLCRDREETRTRTMVAEVGCRAFVVPANHKTKMTALGTQMEQPLYREEEWKKSFTTSTLISSTADALASSPPD
ncbi:hypothetical protein RB195_024671 [Necator americanus]|uniref:Uncharacterized protein n=1 Tax=Necator americanus TaxID=51031 RepID=A0ABR1EP59_NECAM